MAVSISPDGVPTDLHIFQKRGSGSAKTKNPTQLNKGGVTMKPYLKYGDWYIPGFSIKFPTETEAWEYIDSLT